MADVTDPITVTPTPPSAPAAVTPTSSRPLPVREDCWTEEASATLIEEWGRRYLELNRGNLRQKDWQEVADAVNALHAHSRKTHRTDVQCKNRLDTIKKKYKVEKARVLSSNGNYVSNWVFFDKLDFLIGGGVTKPSSEPVRLSLPSPSPASPPVGVPMPHGRSPSPATAKVVGLPQKRSTPFVALALPPPEVVSGVGVDEGFSFSRRNYSKMAAAAARAETEAEDEGVEESGEADEGDGLRRVAKAIEGFVRIYERVEREKLKLSMEMEKQRMQFERDLEMQRMQMYMDTQVQLERMKRRRPSGSD